MTFPSPEQYDFDFTVGAQWSVDLTLEDADEVLIDFSGTNFLFQIRHRVTGAVLCELTSEEDGGIVVDTTNVSITLPADLSADIPAGAHEHDLRAENEESGVGYLIYGSATGRAPVSVPDDDEED